MIFGLSELEFAIILIAGAFIAVAVGFLIYVLKEYKRVKDVDYAVYLDDGLRYRLIKCDIDSETEDSYVLKCGDKTVKVRKATARFITDKTGLGFKKLVKVWIVDNNFVEKTPGDKTFSIDDVIELRKLESISNYIIRKYQAKIWLIAVISIIVVVIAFMIYNYFENSSLISRPIIVYPPSNSTTTPSPLTTQAPTLTTTIPPPIP